MLGPEYLTEIKRENLELCKISTSSRTTVRSSLNNTQIPVARVERVLKKGGLLAVLTGVGEAETQPGVGIELRAVTNGVL